MKNKTEIARTNYFSNFQVMGIKNKAMNFRGYTSTLLVRIQTLDIDENCDNIYLSVGTRNPQNLMIFWTQKVYLLYKEASPSTRLAII